MNQQQKKGEFKLQEVRGMGKVQNSGLGGNRKSGEPVALKTQF